MLCSLYFAGVEKENEKPEVGDLQGLALMAAQVTEDQKMSAIQEEWQLAAEILNQFFMMVYIIVAVLTFALIFLNAPGVVFDYPDPNMDEITRYY